jgi:DNA-directed RNA polymerase III subunit RPC1
MLSLTHSFTCSSPLIVLSPPSFPHPQTLAPTNSPLIMSQCGSKGSPINIAQMVACVGQQVGAGVGFVWCGMIAPDIICSCQLPKSCDASAPRTHPPTPTPPKQPQSVGGKRCFDGFKDRTLPHFPRGDKNSDAKVRKPSLHRELVD